MEYAECQSCYADLSILSSMVLAYASKLLSIINVDFNIVGYLLIRYSEYVVWWIKKDCRGTLCLVCYRHWWTVVWFGQERDIIRYSYSIWYTHETIWNNAQFQTLMLMKTDTILMGDYHINL